MELRKALIERIKIFTGKDFFPDSIYETGELEDFHDQILDCEATDADEEQIRELREKLKKIVLVYDRNTATCQENTIHRPGPTDP